MPKSKKKTGSKAAAAAPYSKKPKSDPLFPARPRNFGIGQDIMPSGRDLGRYVKWPRYVRIQRQRKILTQRLKVPPSIHQFKNTLDKNQATEVFKLLNKYRPETKSQKKERLRGLAASKAEGKGSGSSDKPPPVVKFGLNHVTDLIEKKKAKLVLIAFDVDPLELVMWMPALCRKMDVPYAIVKNKARLGALVHQKNASCVCLTEVAKEDSATLGRLADNFKAQFNDNKQALKTWGGGQMGLRTNAMLDKRAKALAIEAAKKAKIGV